MNYKICEVCVMDTTDPDIRFYGKGGCSNCRNAKKNYLNIKNKCNRKELSEIVKKIHDEGIGKKYNCIIGVSGGVDSSYVAYVVKKLHLRPLAIHLDNGWNSDQAVQNIRKILDKLNIDLYTYTIDWEEFIDIQKSFLKASTPDLEIPTDHAIMAVLYKAARKNHIKYIIDGCNIETESILPRKWSHGHEDWKYIKNIHRKFGTKKIKTFPHFGRFKKLYYEKIAHIERIHILNYVSYNKANIKERLVKEFDWNDYGAKHEESFFTKFYQNYILPKKFGYDKRRMHLSSMIVSGQITRADALRQLEQDPCTKEEIDGDCKQFCDKIQLTQFEFANLMKTPKREYWDYPNYENDFIHKIFDM